jgi:hypothetical protein
MVSLLRWHEAGWAALGIEHVAGTVPFASRGRATAVEGCELPARNTNETGADRIDPDFTTAA